MDFFIRIVSLIFLGIFNLVSFIFSHITKGIGSLIEKITIKVGMTLLGITFAGIVITI